MKNGRITSRGLWLFCLLAAALVSAGAAQAEAGDGALRISLGYLIPMGSGSSMSAEISEFFDSPPVGTFEGVQTLGVDANSDFGLDIGYEFLLTELIGLDAHIGYNRYDVDGEFSGELTYTPWAGVPLAPQSDLAETASLVGKQTGSMNVLPITLGVNFHLTPESPVDAYIGPLVGYAFVSSIDGDDGELRAEFQSFTSVTPLDGGTLSTNDAFTYGAVAGIDVPVGDSGWAFSASAKYMKLAVKTDEPEGLNATIDIDPLSIQAGVGYRF